MEKEPVAPWYNLLLYASTSHTRCPVENCQLLLHILSIAIATLLGATAILRSLVPRSTHQHTLPMHISENRVSPPHTTRKRKIGWAAQLPRREEVKHTHTYTHTATHKGNFPSSLHPNYFLKRQHGDEYGPLSIRFVFDRKRVTKRRQR